MTERLWRALATGSSHAVHRPQSRFVNRRAHIPSHVRPTRPGPTPRGGRRRAERGPQPGSELPGVCWWSEARSPNGRKPLTHTSVTC
ncbi:hypothetical protein TNIN_122021 [Trichonephila inaurata madagascariensis]|uniref:Uncharacterized protein n=1 Tax=Trichonephila inaurata madagascariensis TaxID=2747483 RepID=A0A8X6WRD2_9ARAC|nr:hypothetical protein TNIN_122021 [Trichonephila inaurata madagascariensis]